MASLCASGRAIVRLVLHERAVLQASPTGVFDKIFELW